MTFHVVSLPHTQTTRGFDHCAYTAKVRKFCDMMSSLGHKVYLYASEESDAEAELITVISKSKQKEFFGDNDHKKDFFNITWGIDDPHWQYMNRRAVEEIAKRIQSKDFICLIGGVCQKQIADQFPAVMSVEYGIGYTGTFSKYRVFESYSHMHYVHGEQKDDNGNFYDTVIPNYYDPTEFPQAKKQDYFLYIGRLIDRKGWKIAQEVCRKMNKHLVVAGQGEFKGYGDFRGVVDTKERGKLMSKARAVFVPTTYIEPFGGVHAEAMLCGTPVITTNFGVFTETVVNGVNGQRCDDFQDFLDAVKWTYSNIDYKQIRKDAQTRFSMDKVAPRYEQYFSRLLNLWDKGWYQLR